VRGFLSTSAAVLVALVFALPAGAQQRTPGPDLPGASSPSLAREASARPLNANALERKLRKLARRAPGASGYYVRDLDAGGKAVLFDQSEGKRRKLASNQKLFTTATALSVLGADGRIETKVKVEGSVAANGRLRGDVFLIGGGDPSFGTAGINDLATDLKRAGVKRVGGRVVADPSVFDNRVGVPDSNWGPSEYIAPLRGLVYGGSTYSGDPALQAGQMFKDGLRDAGIKVGGKVKVDEVPKKLRSEDEIGTYESETIASLAAATNKPSNNFYAEMLLKRLAATPERQGSTRKGAKIVERFARRVGSGVDAKDGSGLTNSNKSSPRDVVALLEGVRDQKGIGKAFVDSLAVAGKEGTLDGRMGGTVASGRCRGKTGTINGVSNLSGYCRSGKHMVAFSLLMNGVGSYDAARAIQDKMVVEIARYRP
jgi:D-alanyl-D-alanine carboxypeptidase/D-alanyl-D-alanine-endopeptidase (penicillin-binding protein 4)